jgi:N4-gp56 family major capsid protein
MADKIIDSTEVNVTRMDYIVETVQRELAAQAKVRPLITDVSEFAMPGNVSISFPKLGSLSVQKLSEGQAADAQALTATEDQLDLDQFASVQFILKKQAEIQSRLAFEEAMVSRAASAHARQVDKDIIEAMVSGASSGNDVTYNASDIEDNILEVVQNLDESNAPEEGRFLIFRPAQKKLILSVANFVQAERYGSNIPIMQGEIGMAYGLRFVMSNITTDTFVDGVMFGFQREAATVGFQMDPIIDEQKDIKWGAGSKRIAVDQLYGYKVMQSGLLISVVS